MRPGTPRRRAWRAVAAVAAVRLVGAIAAALPSAATAVEPDATAATLLRHANAMRAAQGVAALQPEPTLARAAQDYARFMARTGRYGHAADGWAQSPPHRANLLDARLVEVGIGVAQAADGRWYGVQLFGRPLSMALAFAVENTGREPLAYALDGERFALPPGVTRSHRSCGAGQLDGPAGSGIAEPGAHDRWR